MSSTVQHRYEKLRRRAEKLPTKGIPKVSRDTLAEKATQLGYQLDAFTRILIGLFLFLLLMIFTAGAFAINRLSLATSGIQSIADFRANTDYRVPEPAFTSAALKDNQLYLGSADKGLYIYNTDSGVRGLWKQYTTSNSELPSDTIDDVAVSGNDVWAVGAGQLMMSTNLDQWTKLIDNSSFGDPTKPLDVERDVTVVRLFAQNRYLLVGTYADGLGIYDTVTHHWQVVNQVDATGQDHRQLFDNHVTALAYTLNQLWVGTTAGLNVFDLNLGSPDPIITNNLKLELPRRDIQEIRVVENAVLIRTQSGGADLLRPDKTGVLQWQSIVGDVGFAALTKPQTISAVLVAQGYLWVGSQANGVGRYELATHTWYLEPSAFTTHSLVDYAGAVWAATSNGVYTFDTVCNCWASQAAAPENVIQLHIYNGDLWYVTAAHNVGVYRNELGQWQSIIGPDEANFHDKQPQLDLRLLSVFQDALWFGTTSDGIAVYDPSKRAWHFANVGLPDAPVIDLKHLGETLWCRVLNNGLRQAYRWTGTSWQMLSAAVEDVVTIQFDGSSTWLLLANGALRNVDQSASAVLFSGQLPAAALTTAVTIDKQLFIGTADHGLWRYDLSNHTWKQLSIVSHTNSIRDLAVNGDQLWYVTGTGGVGIYNASMGVTQPIFPDNPSSVGTPLKMQTMALLNQAVWFGANNGMIYKYNPVTYTTSIQSRGLPVDNFTIEELIADSGVLWLRATLGPNQVGHIYRYEESTTMWQLISPATSDVRQMLIRNGEAWYRTSLGEIYYTTAGEIAADSYFTGGFDDLASIRLIKQDQVGHIWVVSDTQIGVYTLATHHWEVFSVPVAITDSHVLHVKDSDVDLVIFSSTNGLYVFQSTAQTIVQLPKQLDGNQVKKMVTDSDRLWVLAITQEATPILQVYKLSITKELSISLDRWNIPRGLAELAPQPATSPVSVKAVTTFDNKLWMGGENGFLAAYDAQNHLWQRVSLYKLLTIRQFVIEADTLWVYADNYAQPAASKKYVFQIAKQGGIYVALTPTVLTDAAEIAITDSTIWYKTVAGAVGMYAVANPAASAIMIIDKGLTPVITVDIPNLTGANKVKLLSVWLMEAFDIGIEQSTIQPPSTNLAVRVIGIITAISRWSIEFQKNMAALAVPSQDLTARTIVGYQGDLWVATNDGVWRFSHQPTTGQIIFRFRYEEAEGLPGRNITSLSVMNGQLYAVSQGNTHQVSQFVDNHWQDVSELPPSAYTRNEETWRWQPQNDSYTIQIASTASQDQFRTVDLRVGGFTHDMINGFTVFHSSLWFGTQGGIARYRLNDDYSLTFERLYNNEDGLPSQAIADCVASDQILYCKADQLIFAFDGQRWQPYEGQSPFFVAQESYLQVAELIYQNYEGLNATPPQSLINDILTPKAGFMFDQIDDMSLVDGDLWLKTPVGVWKASFTATDFNRRLKLDQFLPLDEVDIDKIFRGVTEDKWVLPTDSGWLWQKFHDKATGKDDVQIIAVDDRRMRRIFTTANTFADLMILAALPENSGQLVWLGTHQGIWKASLDEQSHTLKLVKFYPLYGNTLIDFADPTTFLIKNDIRYARTAKGQVLRYEAAEDRWMPVSEQPFPLSTTILNDPEVGLTVKIAAGNVLLRTLNNDFTHGKFAFDANTDIVFSDGYLWTATSEGIFQYHLDESGKLTLIKHFTVADGLKTNAIANLRLDQQSNLFARTSETPSTYQTLQNGQWVTLDVDDTPFRLAKTTIQNTPGLATWYTENDALHAELSGRAVQIVDGRFDFDVVYDVLVDGTTLWTLTAHGPMRYENLNTTPRYLTTEVDGIPSDAVYRDITVKAGSVFMRLQSGPVYHWQGKSWGRVDTPDPLLFAHPIAVFVDRDWKLEQEADDQTGNLLRSEPADYSLFQGNKFSFDNVKGIALTETSTWLATGGGVVAHNTTSALNNPLWLALYTRRDGLPADAITRITVTANQPNQPVVLVQDAVYQLQVEQAPAWQAAKVDKSIFSKEQVTFDAGVWSSSLIPETSPLPLLTTSNMPPMYSLFYHRKFAFDYVYSIVADGDSVWIGTEGGLFLARYTTGQLVVVKFMTTQNGLGANAVHRLRKTNSGEVWLLAGSNDVHRKWVNIGLDKSQDDDPVNTITLDQTSTNTPITAVKVNKGLEIWHGATLTSTYTQTQMSLGIFGRQTSLTDITMLLRDGDRIWVITPRALVLMRLDAFP